MADPSGLEFWLIIAAGLAGFALVGLGVFAIRRDYETRNLANIVIVIGGIISFVAANWGFHYISPN